MAITPEQIGDSKLKATLSHRARKDNDARCEFVVFQDLRPGWGRCPCGDRSLQADPRWLVTEVRGRGLVGSPAQHSPCRHPTPPQRAAV